VVTHSQHVWAPLHLVHAPQLWRGKWLPAQCCASSDSILQWSLLTAQIPNMPEVVLNTPFTAYSPVLIDSSFACADHVPVDVLPLPRTRCLHRTWSCTAHCPVSQRVLQLRWQLRPTTLWVWA
jgi:hypothetical protein